MLTLTPSVTTVTQAGTVSVSVNYDGTPSKLELYDEGLLVANVLGPLGPPERFELNYSVLDFGPRRLEVRRYDAGVITASVLAEITVNIPVTLFTLKKDTSFEGTPRWLMRILNQGALVLEETPGRPPLLTWRWLAGNISEPAAYFVSSAPGFIPSSVVTARAWLRERVPPLQLFGVICQAETLSIWNRLETQAALRLKQHIDTGLLGEFSFSLL